MIVKASVWTAALVVLAAVLWPFPAVAQSFAVYEDWSESDHLIRPDRWLGSQFFRGQEVARRITAGTLLMRYRVEGPVVGSSTPSGGIGPAHFISFTNPASITEVAAIFTLDSLTVVTCAANNAGIVTRARPARIEFAAFNDGSSSGGGDRTGDHWVVLHARRDGSTTDPPGVLGVDGFINRCSNADCSSSTGLAGGVFVGNVSVGDTFTLEAVWDKPNKQFLFRLNAGSQVANAYSASDAVPAVVPFANINQFHSVANCHVAPAVIDSTVHVGTVRTNSSAVIP